MCCSTRPTIRSHCCPRRPASHPRRLTLVTPPTHTVGAGGVVFITAGQVFWNLHNFINSLHFTHEDDMAATTKSGRLCNIAAGCFFTGWLLFPIGFSLGPNFAQAISVRNQNLTLPDPNPEPHLPNPDHSPDPA